MDLIADNGELWKLSYEAWVYLLGLAEEHGWQAVGTTIPDEPEFANYHPWDGDYFSSDFQIVSAGETIEIAAALERAIAADPVKATDTRREFIRYLRESGGLMLG